MSYKNSRVEYNKKYWKIWYAKNHKLRLEQSRADYLKNRDKKIAYAVAYGKENKGKRAMASKKYRRNRMKTDINFRVANNLRSRLRLILKRKTKLGSAVNDLGCSVSELKFYLEGKFQDGMTWENYGCTGNVWHIDHMIPLSFFNLTDHEQFLKAVHYTNLQPLWAKENIFKGNKLSLALMQK